MIRRLWQRFGDAVLALAFFGLAVAEAAGDRSFTTPELIGSIAVALAVAVALWQRRRAPLALAVLALASLALRSVIPEGGDGTAYGIPILISAYTVAAHLDGRALVAGGALTAGCAVYLMITDGQDLGGVVFYSLLFGAPFVGGRMMRLLRRQRDEKAKVAVADERQRIARELHDVVAHAISVVVLQSRGGRKVLDSDPAAAREAFDAIERTSSQALDEMRRLLGLLRAEDEPALLAQPTLERVGTLAEELRASGLPVEVVVEGEPVALPPGVDVSAYRIVQEALTNALKHAGPARARVRVAYEAHSVLVEVSDDGTGAPNGNGTGHGLVGIRERVAIVGGELEAGPRPAGGYAVSARLPYAAER
jgi:signal transduction histidine kinase